MSDRPPTRRLTGLYKLPDAREPDDELIDAVAKVIYKQIVEGAQQRAPLGPGKQRRSSGSTDEDRNPEA